MSPAPTFFNFDREAIYAALFALLTPTYAWKNVPTRRVKLWTDVPPEQRPCMFQFEGHDETWQWSNSVNPTVYLEASIFAYFNASDEAPGATTMNGLLNALTLGLLPTGRDLSTGRQTLGGLVQWARIQGSVTRVPGDIDGDGMLILPVRILVNG